MTFHVTYLLDQIVPSETFIHREMELLDRRGWPLTVCVLRGEGDALAYSLSDLPPRFFWRFVKAAASRVAEEAFRAPGAALRILKRLPQAAALARKVSASDSRLIHAHFAGVTADLAAIVARTLGVPWSCSVHARDVFAAQPAALRRRLRTARAVAACSAAAARAVTDAGFPAEAVSVIRHGLPLYDYPFDTIHPDEVIFTASRLEPKKGLDTLLQACTLLQNRGVRFTCVIAGAGSLLGELKRLADEKGLQGSVVFLGWLSQEETRSQVMDASVLALPSRRLPDGDRDGIANILVEALALGTPVVTTTAGAAPEVIQDGVNGRLVPPDDPARLADALAALLGSKELRIRLATAGRQTAETLFEGAACIRQLEALFHHLAEPVPHALPDR